MMATDELDSRVRELTAEVEGEKAVTRQVYQQSIRNGDALRVVQLAIAEVTSRLDHVVQEVIQNTAAARSHGARLESLTRDVTLLRNDQTLLRRDIEELRVHVDARFEELRVHVDARFDAVLDAIRALGPRESPA
jgi:chromosome segregation ATPase